MEIKQYKRLDFNGYVHATPMTRGEYGDYKRANSEAIGLTSAPDIEGYLVIYNKDTLDEYEMWSPKHAFNDHSIEVKTPPPETA